MRLADLLKVPELGLRVLHAADGDLEREFRWTYQTDLLDPGRYLAGGELVLSGMGWRRSPADADVFVRAIAAGGAAGLVAGDAVFGDVPHDVVEACRRHGLPVLGLATEVSFVTVSEHVAGEARSERAERLAASLGRHRQLLSLLATGRPLESLVESVAAVTGLTCRVLTTTGLPVTAADPPLPAAHLDAVTRTFLTSPTLPAPVRVGADGRTYTVFSVGPALGSRLTSWMVLAEGDWTTWDLATTEAVGELAAVLQLDRVRRDEGRRSMDRIAADLFRLVVAGGAPSSEIAMRLHQCGLDPDGVLAVVVAGLPDVEWQQEERALVADAVAHLGPAVVGAGPDGFTVAITSAQEEDYLERLRTAFGRLAPGLARTPLSVGVSEPTALTGLTGMTEAARHAMAVAQRASGPVRVTGGHEVSSHAVLLANVPADVRAIFTERVLGAVLAYDDEHRAGLVDTLRAFLDCDGSWTRAARALHMHVNTVRYRIDKVEQLSGRDLSTLHARIDLYLALQSV